ncbi:MAG: hypothetical protein NT045_06415 [Candidatus Aureabacteria bacterium]|nr:hypothetical protein [Candidatus Auribacterota bacterium]
MKNISEQRIKKSIITLLALFCCMYSCQAWAKDFALIEDQVRISSPGPDGMITVSAPPRTVPVGPNAAALVLVENPKTEPKGEAQNPVNHDGSFSVRIGARPGDKIKITVKTSDGSKKKISRKVPQMSIHTVPKARGGGFSAQGISSPLMPEPTPEIIINYRGSRDTKAVPAGVPLNPEEEIARSGVLPN